MGPNTMEDVYMKKLSRSHDTRLYITLSLFVAKILPVEEIHSNKRNNIRWKYNWKKCIRMNKRLLHIQSRRTLLTKCMSRGMRDTNEWQYERFSEFTPGKQHQCIRGRPSCLLKGPGNDFRWKFHFWFLSVK